MATELTAEQKLLIRIHDQIEWQGVRAENPTDDEAYGTRFRSVLRSQPWAELQKLVKKLKASP